MFAKIPVTILPILATLITLLICVKLVHDELHRGPGQGVAGIPPVIGLGPELHRVSQVMRLGGVERGHEVAQVLRQGVGVVCRHKDPREVLISFKNSRTNEWERRDLLPAVL